ncbi:17.4 kDa class III heat shock protein-like [Vicia villosa]|uniref:17.4 kDa class III heat shock protein-like n=1 Tax=Vicia villosa TaxID=3911 RepID=UPI00273A9DF6|nr:17.4 kDa class III heat shock protein-like [Vicia villosa]
MSLFDMDLSGVVNSLFNLHETPRIHDNHESRKTSTSIPVDILDTPKEYIFIMDFPGLSKSEIQVTVEEENTLVIKSNGKRKRQDGEDEKSNGKRKLRDGEEEEGCKYLRLERRAPQKMVRKFRLPENANVSAITAKCENGVLTVVVEKQNPPPKAKTVEVAIA